MQTKRVVVLTGAGISAESGIRTFRDNDGLWENHRIEDVATPQAWAADPDTVWRFYQARRRQLKEVEPNAAHKALASLQEEVESFLLITQNVDDLHERAVDVGHVLCFLTKHRVADHTNVVRSHVLRLASLAPLRSHR